MSLSKSVFGSLAVFLFLGCASNERPTTTSEPPNRTAPETYLESLTPDQLSEIKQLKIEVPTPETLATPELVELYRAWYLNGYGYSLLTGTRFLPDQIWRKPEEHAKMRGWFDGSGDGALVRHERDIKAAVDELLRKNNVKPPTQE